MRSLFRLVGILAVAGLATTVIAWQIPSAEPHTTALYRPTDLSAQESGKSTGNTQRPAGFKVAFVNIQLLLRSMPGWAQAESTFNKEFKTSQDEATKLQTPFDSAVAQFTRGQAMMSPAQRDAREKELRRQSDSLRAKLQAMETKIQGRENELMAPFTDRLKAVVEGVRAEENYALVIDLSNPHAAAIVAFDKALDITTRLMQRLASQRD